MKMMKLVAAFRLGNTETFEVLFLLLFCFSCTVVMVGLFLSVVVLVPHTLLLLLLSFSMNSHAWNILCWNVCGNH
jgi:hypothetical protein